MALVRATPQFLVGTGGVPELGFEFGGSKVPLVALAAKPTDRVIAHRGGGGSRQRRVYDECL